MQTQILIIGAGPGGYAAAFRAADLGLNVTLVDTENSLGGTCLLRGCIPSKTLLHAAKVISEAREAKEFGIEFPGEGPKIHLEKTRDWKNGVVAKMTAGLNQLCKYRKITFLQGRASFLNSSTVQIQKADNTALEISFEHAIIATGSVPATLPFAPNSPRVMDSSAALNLEDIPRRLLVVGGGYIGLELGTVYRELGSQVSVVEMTPSLLPGVDPDLSRILAKRLTSLLESIKLNTKVIKMDEAAGSVAVTLEDKEGKPSTERYDKVLIAVGRKPNTQNLGLENTKVQITDRGFLQVNTKRQTTDPQIYAVGDAAGNPMLAHKATREGTIAAEVIAGTQTAFEPKAIPAVVFTDPEIAWCGLTETQAKEESKEVKIAKFLWGASGRAATLNRAEGVTKLLVDPKTERILGVAIAGVGAGELISEGVLAVEAGARVTDLKKAIHPHPTLSETLSEAAENFLGTSISIYRPKKS